MPVMEYTVQTIFHNQVCINRWNYLASGTPASVTFSFALANAIGVIVGGAGTDFIAGTVMAEWQNNVHSDVGFVQFQAKDVYDPVDFYDSPINAGTTGDAVGTTSLSPVTAFGFRSNRTRLDIGRAYKRFQGVFEGALKDGGEIETATLVFLADLADVMGDIIEYDDAGNTLTFAPMVVSKEKYTVPSSGKTAYRYYPTETEQLDHIMTGISWTSYTQTRSQTSRQYGHGG